MDMAFVYKLDAWIYRSWYKKCIREICKIDPDSLFDKEKIKESILNLIDKNGIPMEMMEMDYFSAMERSMKWGFWYWVKRTENRLVKKGTMQKEKFYAIAEEAFYPLMMRKIWEWRDGGLVSAVLGRRKKK